MPRPVRSGGVSLSERPRIHFVLPVPSQPRFHKRIAGFEALGVPTSVYAFEREYFQGNASNLRYHRLGRLQHRSYTRRLPALLNALPILAGRVRGGDILYCFGLDTALLGMMTKRLRRSGVRLVYECGDITAIMVGKGRFSRALRSAERLTSTAADRVVITSPEFGTNYFVPVQGVPVEKLFVIENKLDIAPTRPAGSSSWNGDRPLRLGYFGLLRDPLAWRIMLAWASQSPDLLSIDVRGYPFGIEGFRNDLERHANVSFGGEYVYPADLPGMYGGVDLVWVTYPKPEDELSDRRWQWPRTNRFYEACYFRKPMIGQTGSADGALIERHDIGLTIDTAKPDEALSRLQAIRPADLDHWAANLLQIPVDCCVASDEHRRLLTLLT